MLSSVDSLFFLSLLRTQKNYERTKIISLVSDTMPWKTPLQDFKKGLICLNSQKILAILGLRVLSKLLIILFFIPDIFLIVCLMPMRTIQKFTKTLVLILLRLQYLVSTQPFLLMVKQPQERPIL